MRSGRMFFLKNFAFTSFIISNQSGCFPDMKSQFLKRVRNIFTSVRFFLTAYSFLFVTKSYASIQAPSEEREERQDLQIRESGHGKAFVYLKSGHFAVASATRRLLVRHHGRASCRQLSYSRQTKLCGLVPVLVKIFTFWYE